MAPQGKTSLPCLCLARSAGLLIHRLRGSAFVIALNRFALPPALSVTVRYVLSRLQLGARCVSTLSHWAPPGLVCGFTVPRLIPTPICGTTHVLAATRAVQQPLFYFALVHHRWDLMGLFIISQEKRLIFRLLVLDNNLKCWPGLQRKCTYQIFFLWTWCRPYWGVKYCNLAFILTSSVKPWWAIPHWHRCVFYTLRSIACTAYL